MKKWLLSLTAVVAVGAFGFGYTRASSHREAPLISQDPLADNTDVYAFVSPNNTDRVTLVANFIPLEAPYGGPNFFKFDDNVLYDINIDNDGDAVEDVVFEFRFRTEVRNPNTFLYNTGPITSLDSPNFNVRQFYTVTRYDGRRIGRGTVLAENLPTPPVNVGFRSTPNYDALAQAAVRQLPNGTQVFAGQRDDPFFVDLNVFDLLAVPPADNDNSDSLAGFNVHTIAIEVPISSITANGTRPSSSSDRECGRRRLVHGQPPLGHHARRRSGEAQRALRPGLAARTATGQRGGHSARREGRVQFPAPDR